jgi:hypothetical protein
MMIQVGVERDAVAIGQLVLLSIAVQDERAALHQRRLAATGLVARWVAGAARARSGGQRVARELRPLAGNRRGEDLVAVPGRVAGSLSTLRAAHDRDRTVLVEAQQLREPQLQTGRDPPGHPYSRAGLAALDLREHRSAYAAALGEVAEREAHRFTQSTDAGTQVVLGDGNHAPYAITYGRMSGSRPASLTPCLSSQMSSCSAVVASWARRG